MNQKIDYICKGGNNIEKKKIFENGELKELIIFDSKGISPVSKYEIQDVQSTSYKCRKTKYINNGYISQVYWLKKESEIDNTWDELTFESSTNADMKKIAGVFYNRLNEGMKLEICEQMLSSKEN